MPPHTRRQRRHSASRRLRLWLRRNATRLFPAAQVYGGRLEEAVGWLANLKPWANQSLGLLLFTLLYLWETIFGPRRAIWNVFTLWMLGKYYLYSKYAWIMVSVFVHTDRVYFLFRRYSRPCYNELTAHREFYTLVALLVLVVELQSEGGVLRVLLWLPGYILYWHFPVVWRPIFDPNGPRGTWNKIFYPLTVFGFQWMALFLTGWVFRGLTRKLTTRWIFLILWAGLWTMVEARIRGAGLPWPEMHSRQVVGPYGQCLSVFAIAYQAYLLWLRRTPGYFIGLLVVSGLLYQMGIEPGAWKRPWNGVRRLVLPGSFGVVAFGPGPGSSLSQEELQHLRERGINDHGLLQLRRAGVDAVQLRAMVTDRRIAREWRLVAEDILTEHDLQYLHGTEEEFTGLLARLTEREATRLLDALETWSDSDEDKGHRRPPPEDEFEPHVPGTSPREVLPFWNALFTPGRPLNKPPLSGILPPPLRQYPH